MSSVDGGLVALSGFLYQILAVAGLKAWSLSTMTGPLDGDGLVVACRDSSLQHEAFGADAALLPSSLQSALEQGAVLLQMKFSAKSISLDSGEVREIAKRFAEASEVAATHAERQVTHYFIVTNRDCTPQAQALLAKTSIPETTTKGGAGSADAKLQKSIQHVLSKTSSHRLTLGSAEEYLRRFAGEYGVLPSEVDAGVQRLVGTIFRQTGMGGSCEVTREIILECLAGSRRTKRLRRAEFDSQARIELECLGSFESESSHVHRKHIEKIEVECASRALIVFIGFGGKGKSASLNAWARQLTMNETKPFVRGCEARKAPENWAENCAQEWRGLPPEPNPSVDGALARLRAANPTIQRPILLLSLDGLDEKMETPTRRYLERLIGHFWRMDREHLQDRGELSDARLVVTCRTRKEFEKFLPGDNSGFPRSSSFQYRFYEFSDFTDDEFDDAVAVSVPRLKTRLLVDRRKESRGFSGPSELSPSSFVGPDIVGGPQTLLRDPATWRAFLDLDEPTQDGVLRREPAAMATLGGKLVDRFCHRTERRLDWPKRRVEPFLKAIAHGLRESPGPWNFVHWETKGRPVGIFNDSDSAGVFSEAISGGLIGDAYEDWRWRNECIEACLIQL